MVDKSVTLVLPVGVKTRRTAPPVPRLDSGGDEFNKRVPIFHLPWVHNNPFTLKVCVSVPVDEDAFCRY